MIFRQLLFCNLIFALLTRRVGHAMGKLARLSLAEYKLSPELSELARTRHGEFEQCVLPLAQPRTQPQSFWHEDRSTHVSATEELLRYARLVVRRSPTEERSEIIRHFRHPLRQPNPQPPLENETGKTHPMS